MAPSTRIPSQIAGYSVFPLSLPFLSSLSQSASHYLYVAPHEPKIPVATASRSLFLVNVPFDATEAHIKHLLSAQIGLPAGRVENVQFEGQRRNVSSVSEGAPTASNSYKKGKKRKRGHGVANLDRLEGDTLPKTWDRDLQTNGLTAVVLFVDRASMDAALKAVNTTRKERVEPIWGEGVEGKVAALGSASWCPYIQWLLCILI